MPPGPPAGFWGVHLPPDAVFRARAEFALLAPFAPTSEPALLVTVCFSVAHVAPLAMKTRSSARLPTPEISHRCPRTK